jgi:hypothetical protein
MKRLDYLQQKLPHSLHETGMLEGSEPSVCSILHTLAAIPISPCRPSSRGRRMVKSIWTILGALRSYRRPRGVEPFYHSDVKSDSGMLFSICLQEKVRGTYFLANGTSP